MPNIDWYGSINEAYIGKTKDILKLESCIHEMRQGKDNKVYFAGADTSKFNKLAADIFGFKLYELNIFPSAMANAYTQTIDCKLDTIGLKKNAICDPKGFKYKKEAGYVCVTSISSGLFFDPRYTDGEILAIILHEIGHNFASIVNDMVHYNAIAIKLANVILSIINLISGNGGIYISMNKIDELNIKFTEWIGENCKALAIFIMVVNNATNIISDIMNNIWGAMSNIMIANPQKVVNVIMGKIQQFAYGPTNYANEKIADNFVTVYGYGTELSSALSKLEAKTGIATYDIPRNIPVIGHLIELKDLPVNILINAFDEHPQWLERSQDQIRLLEDELKKSNLSPKMKKEIQNQVDELKESEAKYMDTMNNIADPSVFKKAWYSAIYNVAGGDIKHHVLGKGNIKRIDKTLGTEESANLLDW